MITSDFLPEARALLLPIWTQHGLPTRGLRTRGELFEAVTHQLATWMATAAQNQENADYYRGLVVKCGKHIGKEAYTQDDGGVVEDVLCDKVPELVESLTKQLAAALTMISIKTSDNVALSLKVEKLEDCNADLERALYHD